MFPEKIRDCFGIRKKIKVVANQFVLDCLALLVFPVFFVVSPVDREEFLVWRVLSDEGVDEDLQMFRSKRGLDRFWKNNQATFEYAQKSPLTIRHHPLLVCATVSLSACICKDSSPPGICDHCWVSFERRLNWPLEGNFLLYRISARLEEERFQREGVLVSSSFGSNEWDWGKKKGQNCSTPRSPKINWRFLSPKVLWELFMQSLRPKVRLIFLHM